MWSADFHIRGNNLLSDSVAGLTESRRPRKKLGKDNSAGMDTGGTVGKERETDEMGRKRRKVQRGRFME